MLRALAHEINTSLSATQSSVSTLIRASQKLDELLADNDSERVTRRLAAIADAARVTAEGMNRIHRTVSTLKNLARLDESPSQTVDVGKEIDGAVDLSRRSCARM